MTTVKAQCGAWRAITYCGSATKNCKQADTAVTVQQVRVHNLTGQKLGCWK